LEKISVDIVYIDSSLYSSVEEFIYDKFDFDFLKNSWNGRILKIMKSMNLFNKESKYYPPEISAKDGTNDWIYRNSYLLESLYNIYYPIPFRITELEMKRKNLYKSRGFTIF
jgi:hypothetical protein